MLLSISFKIRTLKNEIRTLQTQNLLFSFLNLLKTIKLVKLLCTSTAPILLICTEKPRLAKRLHALYRVLLYLRAPFANNLHKTCNKRKKSQAYAQHCTKKDRTQSTINFLDSCYSH